MIKTTEKKVEHTIQYINLSEKKKKKSESWNQWRHNHAKKNPISGMTDNQ